MLKVSNIAKTFKTFELRNISFNLSSGDYLLLSGPSGAGKSLILECISGITTPDLGTITFNGRNITNLPIRKRKIGMVFQDSRLFPHMNVYKNIAYGLKANSRSIRTDEIKAIATLLGIDDLLERMPHKLSGGEGQRVAIARTIILGPKLILLDEPFSALDKGNKQILKDYLKLLNQDHGITFIHVSHDEESISDLANKFIEINNGSIIND